MEQHKRTVTCGSLRASFAGKRVTLNGWVHRLRNHGGIFFINVRDRWGITQVVVDETAAQAAREAAALLHNEFCVAVEGTVRERPAATKNDTMATGAVEVLAETLIILNPCLTLPFPVDGDTPVKEELRLKYRYLDLRREGMTRRLALRGEVSFAAREFMREEDFIEVETPTFIKSTPEGARDYLVPSRLYPGHFYALPQSPQLYKQLLMAGGIEKYFQIARCYRDEDSRGDRQPEFTQLDIEMSFAGRDDILLLIERLMGRVFTRTLGVSLPEHFRRLSCREAMERYGTDKPDLRFGMELRDFAPLAAASGFSAFTGALEQGEAERRAAGERGITKEGGGVKALVVKGGASRSRKQIEELEEKAKVYKAKGLAWMKLARKDGALALEGGVARFFEGKAEEVARALDAGEGDLILIVADARRRTANTALGAVRSALGRELLAADAAQAGTFEFAWIVDFPLFEYNEEEARWEAAHHLFTSPRPECLGLLETDPGAVLGDLYDLVLNGYELASGSVRIHDAPTQERVFAAAGIGKEDAAARFGFLTGAFKYGAPPHCGIAAGLDRLLMLMTGQNSIKEVIAFPKNSFAQNPMDQCPSQADEKQLAELHIQIAASAPARV